MNKKISRRDILKLAGASSVGLILSSCGIPATETPTATNTPVPTETATLEASKTPIPSATPIPTKIPRTELDVLRNIRDYLNGIAPLELEDDLPQPPSGTTLRLYLLDRARELEAAGTIQPNELALIEPLSSGVPAKVINTTHFTITYDPYDPKNPKNPNYVSDQIANDVATDLEAGWTSFYNYFGFNSSNITQVHFDAKGSNYTDLPTGIHFKADSFRSRDNNRASRTVTTIHEAFHSWQFLRGWSTTTSRIPISNLFWVMEGTAVWASLKWSASTPSLDAPAYIEYWFDHPDEITLIAANGLPATGYVTLPFWMWLEKNYPTALEFFLYYGPNYISTMNDLVNYLVSQIPSAATFEGLVCLFGCALVNNTWNPYLTIWNVEQPIRTTFQVPIFTPSQNPDFSQKLIGQGDTWTSSWELSPGAIYIFSIQYLLVNQAPSKTWQGSLSIDSLTGSSGITAYYAVGIYPTTANSEYNTPSQYFPPRSSPVYLITCGNQHYFNTPDSNFNLSIIASFIGT